jgi:hypothetical protein
MDISGKEKYRLTKRNLKNNNREQNKRQRTDRCGDLLIQAALCVLGTDGYRQRESCNCGNQKFINMDILKFVIFLFCRIIIDVAEYAEHSMKIMSFEGQTATLNK